MHQLNKLIKLNKMIFQPKSMGFVKKNYFLFHSTTNFLITLISVKKPVDIFPGK